MNKKRLGTQMNNAAEHKSSAVSITVTNTVQQNGVN